MEEEKIKCPNCGSTQITAGKKGFSAGKAAAGAMLTGGIGILAGRIGAGKIKLTCLKCGHSWKPGLTKEEKQQALIDNNSATREKLNASTKKLNESITPGGCIVVVIVFIIIYFLIAKL